MEYNVVLPRKGSRTEVISTAITNQNTWFIERSSLMRKKCGIPIIKSEKYTFFLLSSARVARLGIFRCVWKLYLSKLYLIIKNYFQ